MISPEAQRAAQLMAGFATQPGDIRSLISPEDYQLLQSQGFVSQVLPVGMQNPWDPANRGKTTNYNYADVQAAQAPQPQMTTPSTGGTNSAGSQPTASPQTTNMWASQPKPADTSGRAAMASNIRSAAAPVQTAVQSGSATGGLNGMFQGAWDALDAERIKAGWTKRADGGWNDAQGNPSEWGGQGAPGQFPYNMPRSSLATPLPGLPGDTATGGYVGQNGLWNEAAVMPAQAAQTSIPDRSARAGAYQPQTAINRLAQPVSTPAAGGFTEAGGMVQPTMPVGPNRQDWMGYGPNGGGLRVDPTYLPEVWDYRESPEYLWRQQQAERGLNRLLLNRGRSDSTGGINALANLRSNIAADEVDKQYQRALAANQANYGRYLGANVENYGRTRGEDQTAYQRALGENILNYERQYQLGEQDWNRASQVDNTNWGRNAFLANLGLNATNTGVQAGNATGLAIANLLQQNGATQAGLAVQSGAVSGATIQALLNAGLNYKQIEALFGGATTPNPSGSTATTTAPVGGSAGLTDFDRLFSEGGF